MNQTAIQPVRRFRLLSMADLSACPDALEPLQGIATIEQLAPCREQLLQSIGEFDGYLASLHVRLDEEILRAAHSLKVIVTPSTGLDHIDLSCSLGLGIEVLSLKEDRQFLDSITATAEMSWALLLAVVRRLPASFAAAQRGEWARDAFRGHQLSGQTLGILGYGRLGRMVARYGLVFGMRVLACDTSPGPMAPGVRRVEFGELLESSDVLSLHIHLTEANRNLLDAVALQRMKPGAILINTSRGGIVDEAALLEALRSGRLGGAGLDVICGEWRQDLQSHPLISYAREHDNLVISPHTGGVTWESQAAAYRHSVQKLLHYLQSARESGVYA